MATSPDQPPIPSAPAPPAAAAAPAQPKPPQVTAPVNPPGAGRPASSVVTPAQTAQGTASWPRYKVEPPAASFQWQGLTVGAEPTPVPPTRAGQLLSAAAAAGVTLTLES
jgi:hypothetical protein